MIYFADTSALGRAYLADEEDHEELRTLLFESDNLVTASELALLEMSRAISAAARARRLGRRAARDLLDQLDADVGEEGPIVLLGLEPGPVLARGRELVLRYQLGSLDAMHLAVAEQAGRRLADPEPLVFVSRDQEQRKVAKILGFATT